MVSWSSFRIVSYMCARVTSDTERYVRTGRPVCRPPNVASAGRQYLPSTVQLVDGSTDGFLSSTPFRCAKLSNCAGHRVLTTDNRICRLCRTPRFTFAHSISVLLTQPEVFGIRTNTKRVRKKYCRRSSTSRLNLDDAGNPSNPETVRNVLTLYFSLVEAFASAWSRGFARRRIRRCH